MLNKLKLTQTKFRLNGKEINLTADNTIIKSNNFNVDRNGNLTCNNGIFNSGTIHLYDNGSISGANLKIFDNENDCAYFSSTSILIGTTDNYGSDGINTAIFDDTITTGYWQNDALQYGVTMGVTGEYGSNIQVIYNGSHTGIYGDGIWTPRLVQTSKKEYKKNFEKLNNGLDIIKNIDIYKYNLKSEEDNTKKHIGFVIGDDFKYSKEITSTENDGVDTYSFISVCCKAIQEQQEMIEQLQEKIKELEEK